MSYSHDYRKMQLDENEATELFEKEAAEYLRGCDSDDVGGVILYMRAGDEVAFFDYEMLVGSVYEITGKHSWETEMEWDSED